MTTAGILLVIREDRSQKIYFSLMFTGIIFSIFHWTHIYFQGCEYFPVHLTHPLSSDSSLDLSDPNPHKCNTNY